MSSGVFFEKKNVGSVKDKALQIIFISLKLVTTIRHSNLNLALSLKVLVNRTRGKLMKFGNMCKVIFWTFS